MGKYLLKHFSQSCLISIGLCVSEAYVRGCPADDVLVVVELVVQRGHCSIRSPVMLQFLANEASCCSGSRPRGSVPCPWQRTTPGNERRMPITRGCDRAGLCCAVLSHLVKLECVLCLEWLLKQVKSSAVCVNLPL